MVVKFSKIAGKFQQKKFQKNCGTIFKNRGKISRKKTKYDGKISKKKLKNGGKIHKMTEQFFK